MDEMRCAVLCCTVLINDYSPCIFLYDSALAKSAERVFAILSVVLFKLCAASMALSNVLFKCASYRRNTVLYLISGLNRRKKKNQTMIYFKKINIQGTLYWYRNTFYEIQLLNKK